MPLYAVAFIEKPLPKEAEQGAVEKILLEPVWVVAKDDKVAAAIAMRRNADKIPEEKLDRAEALVRPF